MWSTFPHIGKPMPPLISNHVSSLSHFARFFASSSSAISRPWTRFLPRRTRPSSSPFLWTSYHIFSTRRRTSRGTNERPRRKDNSAKVLSAPSRQTVKNVISASFFLAAKARGSKFGVRNGKWSVGPIWRKEKPQRLERWKRKDEGRKP